MKDERALGLEFMHALWAGDLNRCGKMLADEATWHFQLGMPQAQIGRGRIWPAREAMQRIVDDLFGKFDPDGFTVTPTRIIGDSGAVAIEYQAKGQTSKGETYHNYYVTILVIEGGKIKEIRPYNDTTHMLNLLRD